VSGKFPAVPLRFYHTLIHVRHGETDWNAEARLQGQRDIPLNPRGRAQARRNGMALAEWLARDGLSSKDFDWVASPLVRARETMELIRAALGVDPAGYRTDPVLKEISFGEWEGSTIAELAERDPAGHEARLLDKWAFVPPGGESYAMLSERIGGWLRRLDRDTVCVAHGAVHRAVRSHLEGLDPAEAPTLDVPQDRLYVWRGSAVWI
jgi:broad specificity phosphatase PhoE